MKLDEIEVDTRAENEGDWVESPEFPGVWAKVRSMRNPDFRRAYQTEMRKARRKYGNQPIPVEVEDKINARLVVDHVLLDLKGLEDSEGNEIALTHDFAVKIMEEPKYRKLADFIAWAATVVGDTQDEQLEDDVKNSSSA